MGSTETDDSAAACGSAFLNLRAVSPTRAPHAPRAPRARCGRTHRRPAPPCKTDVSLVPCRLPWCPPQRQRSPPVPRVQLRGLQPGPGGLAAGGAHPRAPRRAGTCRAGPSPSSGVTCLRLWPLGCGVRGGPAPPHTRPREGMIPDEGPTLTKVRGGCGRGAAVTRGVCRELSSRCLGAVQLAGATSRL